MSKQRMIAAALLALPLLAAGAQAGEKGSVTGEVIDSACYIKGGSRGADHAKCASACGKMGIPLALVTDDGKVVWLASDKDMEGVNEMLEPYVAKKVTLEGEWFEKGGTKLFAISKVSPAKP